LMQPRGNLPCRVRRKPSASRASRGKRHVRRGQGPHGWR
jgi:hypothetical protein